MMQVVKIVLYDLCAALCVVREKMILKKYI